MDEKQTNREQSIKNDQSTTPYDDAWRTLTTTVPNLLIPMVNEVFGTSFTEKAVVILNQNEHLFSTEDGKVEKRVTDTNFSVIDEAFSDSILGNGFDIIEGPLTRHYIFECESKAVSPAVLVRIIEYSVKSAVESGTIKDKMKLTIYVPQVAILSLRSTVSTPSEVELEIVMESGSCRSAIRVMKLSDYDADQIFAKKLYLLIPFLLFNYEKHFDQLEKREEDYNRLIALFRSVFYRVDELIPLDDDEATYIDLFSSKALRAMTHTVVNGLAGKYPKIQEGVNAVVGGNIIEFEALKIKREGMREGMRKGRREGRREGKREGMREGRRQGEANAYHDTAERMINAGKPGDEIAAFTSLDRKDIDNIARQLNRTVLWGETRA